MKRIVLFSLLCLLALGLFAGCGEKKVTAFEYGVTGFEYGVADYEYGLYGVTDYEYGPYGAAGFIGPTGPNR